MLEVKETITALMAKAKDAPKSEDALRFSQAAVNIANAKYAFEPQPKIV